MTQRYIDPNSGAAPQPGGYGGSVAPVQKEGEFDVAVADEVTEAQEADKAADDNPTPPKAAPKPVKH